MTVPTPATRAKIARVKQLVAAGASLTDACDEVDLAYSTWLEHEGSSASATHTVAAHCDGAAADALAAAAPLAPSEPMLAEDGPASEVEPLNLQHLHAAMTSMKLKNETTVRVVTGPDGTVISFEGVPCGGYFTADVKLLDPHAQDERAEISVFAETLKAAVADLGGAAQRRKLGVVDLLAANRLREMSDRYTDDAADYSVEPERMNVSSSSLQAELLPVMRASLTDMKAGRPVLCSLWFQNDEHGRRVAASDSYRAHWQSSEHPAQLDDATVPAMYLDRFFRVANAAGCGDEEVRSGVDVRFDDDAMRWSDRDCDGMVSWQAGNVLLTGERLERTAPELGRLIPDEMVKVGTFDADTLADAMNESSGEDIAKQTKARPNPTTNPAPGRKKTLLGLRFKDGDVSIGTRPLYADYEEYTEPVHLTSTPEGSRDALKVVEPDPASSYPSLAVDARYFNEAVQQAGGRVSLYAAVVDPDNKNEDLQTKPLLVMPFDVEAPSGEQTMGAKSAALLMPVRISRRR